ncbi:MAG: hypothetical protein EA424_26205, partial [Planctomycetaceae bacterium]
MGWAMNLVQTPEFLEPIEDVMNANRSPLVVGALLGIVLIAAVIWVIRSEGERTRQAIREARPEPIRAAEVTAEKLADQAKQRQTE